MKKQAKIFSITAIFVLAVFGGITASNTQLIPTSSAAVYAAPTKIPESNIDPDESVYPVKKVYHVGDVLTFTIKVTNDGPDTATNLSITDSIHPELKFLSATGSYSYNSGNLTWHLPNLKKGESRTISYKVKILKSAAGTTVTDKAEAWVTGLPNHIDANIIWINVAKTSNSSNNNSSANTIPLQHTGLPVAGLTLAVMAVSSGLTIPKRKN